MESAFRWKECIKCVTGSQGNNCGQNYTIDKKGQCCKLTFPQV